MERATAIGDRASECRVASVGRDQTLLHGRVAPGSFQYPVAQLFPTCVNWLNKIKHGDQQGVDDEAIVIVPAKIKSVSVCTVTFVPLLMRADCQLDRLPTPFSPHAGKERFNHR